MTDVFLKCFGLNALSDLPALPALEEVAEEGDVQLELLAADGDAQTEEEESSEALTEDGAERAEEIDETLHTEENID